LALHAHEKKFISTYDLAELACHLEIDILGEPVGKQDQFISAFGGLQCFTIQPDGTVIQEPLKVDQETLFNLEDNLLTFFTGYSRSASEILKDQDVRTKVDDQQMMSNLHFVKDLGLKSRQALEGDDLTEFARLMREHWDFKRKRSKGMSNSSIDEAYELGLKNGAMAGKLVGAGGGGFLMFYTEDRLRLRKAFEGSQMKEVRFRFEFEGTKIVAQ
jgi:D-glycero-alpha-D-manno-heptose-7-phosphate kinase